MTSRWRDPVDRSVVRPAMFNHHQRKKYVKATLLCVQPPFLHIFLCQCLNRISRTL